MSQYEPIIVRTVWAFDHAIGVEVETQPEVGGVAAFTPELLAQAWTRWVRWNGREVILLCTSPASVYRIEGFDEQTRAYVARRAA